MVGWHHQLHEHELSSTGRWGQRHRHRGHIVDTGEGECGARWRSSMDVYTLLFGKDNWREAAGQQRAQLRALG